MLYKELLVILDLGDGLNGYPKVLHGGFAATLLDETCGALIQLNVFEKVRRLGSQHSMNYLTACKWTICEHLVSLKADGSDEI